MARWEAAYDALTDAYQWFKSPVGQRYLGGWAESMGKSDSFMARTIADGLPERTVADLFNAEPFWVDDDMMTLWEAAIPGFEPEPLRATDLPTPNGFVYLPHPLPMVDIHGTAISARAFMWTTRTITVSIKGQSMRVPGITLVAFHQLGDPDGYDAMNRLDAKALGFRAGVLLLDHAMPWMFSAEYPRNDRSVQKPFQCLLRLMQQTIVTREQSRPPKPWRSRARKVGLDDERHVVVVRLRRPAPRDGHEPRTVDWDHRWVVSGHWRRQFYPSLDEHRQIWISAFVKGPEDRELLVRKARVWELVQ